MDLDTHSIGISEHDISQSDWLQMLQEFADDIIPLIIPAKGGTTEAVRVVLTSSKEDKDLFEVSSEYSYYKKNE